MVFTVDEKPHFKRENWIKQYKAVNISVIIFVASLNLYTRNK
jgi:hypothetical protein